MKYKHALSIFPHKFHQVVPHARSVCLQLDKVNVSLTKVQEDGQFLTQQDLSQSITVKPGKLTEEIERIAIRIPLDMLKQIKEALDGIESTNS
jgi:hypothetical protein